MAACAVKPTCRWSSGVHSGSEDSEVEDEEEEQTWDTRSNTTTYLKTSASTWHCALCCSQVAARRGLMERGRRDRLEKIITVWALTLLQME